VDDDPVIQDLLGAALPMRWPGITVVTASDGDEALRVFSAQQPDLVLLDVELPGRSGFELVLFGTNHGELGGSEYLKSIHGLLRGAPPVLDLDAERALQRLLVDLAATDRIRSAHDCAEGGLAVTLAECCFDTGGVGAVVDVTRAASDGGVDLLAATLFGESASRVLVSVAPEALDAVLQAAARAGVPAAQIGRTGGHQLVIRVNGEVAVDCRVSEAEGRWAAGLSNWLDGQAA